MELPIIFDHDLGTNPDDFFALLLLRCRAPERLRLLISGNNFAVKRALAAASILADVNLDPDMSYAGEETGRIEFFGDELIHPGQCYNTGSYLDAMRRLIEANPKVIYLCTEGLSNLDRFMSCYPEHAQKLEVYHMGLDTRGYGDWVKGGTNIEADPQATRRVYSSKLDMMIIGAHTTTNDKLRVTPDTDLCRVIQREVPVFRKLVRHLADFTRRRAIYPCLHDPLAAAVSLGENFCDFERISIDFDQSGRYRKGKEISLTVSQEEPKADAFMTYMAHSLDMLVR